MIENTSIIIEKQEKFMPKMQTKPISESSVMSDYINQKHVEHETLEFLNKKEKSISKKYDSIERIDQQIKQSYTEMQDYDRAYSKIYEQEYMNELNRSSLEEKMTNSTTDSNDDDMIDLNNVKLTFTVEEVIKNQQHTRKSFDEIVKKQPKKPDHLKTFDEIENIVDKQAKEFTAYTRNSKSSYELHNSTKKEVEEIMQKKSMNPFTSINVDVVKQAEPIKKVGFEKNKFLKASWFMKIGHYIGLSLRNQYYENFDKEIIKALDNDQVYKVLEAQKNGYYLGKKLNKLTMSKVYESLTNNPSALLDELVQRDILLSYDQLSLIIFSDEGKELIKNQVPEYYPYAKTLIQDLLKKENFLFANKNLWLNSLKDKELFLQENNPLFYHDKMLEVCEKSELLTVKKVVGDFLQEEDVLKSISKNKLIDKMLLKLDMLLGNSVELDHMVLDLPETAQKLYKSIKEIKFSEGDLKILQENHQFDYDLVEKRMPEAVIKYLNVDTSHRNSLKNQNNKTAEDLLLETLENILVLKKDLNLFVNQAKISELSVTRRYTDNIRGDIGKPSLFTLKTLQQLKESGELIDLSNETINETIDKSKSSETSHNLHNNETIVETNNEDLLTKQQLIAAQQLAETVKGVRITHDSVNKKKLKI